MEINNISKNIGQEPNSNQNLRNSRVQVSCSKTPFLAIFILLKYSIDQVCVVL